MTSVVEWSCGSSSGQAPRGPSTPRPRRAGRGRVPGGRPSRSPSPPRPRSIGHGGHDQLTGHRRRRPQAASAPRCRLPAGARHPRRSRASPRVLETHGPTLDPRAGRPRRRATAPGRSASAGPRSDGDARRPIWPSTSRPNGTSALVACFLDGGVVPRGDCRTHVRDGRSPSPTPPLRGWAARGWPIGHGCHGQLAVRPRACVAWASAARASGVRLHRLRRRVRSGGPPRHASESDADGDAVLPIENDAFPIARRRGTPAGDSAGRSRFRVGGAAPCPIGHGPRRRPATAWAAGRAGGRRGQSVRLTTAIATSSVRRPPHQVRAAP
jgi:hypothetical protein